MGAEVMISRKKVTVMLVLVVFLFSLSGISFAEDVNLEFQQWWEGELPDGLLRGLVDQYTVDTGTDIKLLSNPYADTKIQISAGAATGTMADVVGLDGAWVYDFASQSSISDLSKLMVADSYDDSQLSSQIKVKGNTYMIPVVNFAYPMYVNLGLLAKTGITKLPETRSEFIAAAKAVRENTDAYGWIIPLSTSSPSGIQNAFMSWLWASGGSMLENGKPHLTDNPKLLETVEFVKSLFDNDLVSNGVFSMTEPDMVEEFANGRVAFMTDSLAHLTTLKRESPDLQMAVIGVPKADGYTGKSGMCVANWGIGVASNSDYKAASMDFIEYLMSPEVNAKLAVAANAFPGNTNASPDYSSADPLFIDAYNIFTEGYAINEFTGLPTSEELMRTFDENFQLYISGDIASAEEMLALTQSEWEKAF